MTSIEVTRFYLVRKSTKSTEVTWFYIVTKSTSIQEKLLGFTL